MNRSLMLRQRVDYLGASAGIMLESEIVELADLAEREFGTDRILHSSMAVVRSRARLQNAIPALAYFDSALQFYAGSHY
jgi:hypothetical protein